MDWTRIGLGIDTSRWKALLVAFVLFSVTVMGMEGVAAVSALVRGTEGRLGIIGDATVHDGRRVRTVRGFEAWSLLPQAGVQVGDVLYIDRWYDRGRSYRPGEELAATVVRNGQALPLRVRAAERPIPGRDRWHFILNAVLCGLGTLLGLMIGWRQAGSPTSRALAMAFLWWALNLGDRYAPAAAPAFVVSLVNVGALMPGWYLGLWFAIHYPDEQPQGLRRHLRRVLPIFLIALLPVEGVALAQTMGYLLRDWASWTQLPYMGAAGTLMLLSFWSGWRHSVGELRQRFAWLLGSFSLLWFFSYSTWWGNLLGVDLSAWLGTASVCGSLLALLGLTYAILRHRVLDLGLVLNRSLVFALVGAVLLGSFQFLQVVAGRLLHFDDPAKAGLLSAVLAGFVVLAYPKVKPRAEWLVDRLFFGAWVAREADLARFATDARGFTDAAALAAALVQALDRFAGAAGAALYVRARSGHYERQAGATLDAPAGVEADEPLVVSLRAGRAEARAEDVHSALPAEIALVLSRQRELDAFVLIGPQRDGRPLRPDEVAALCAALTAAGAEWHALRWQALQG